MTRELPPRETRVYKELEGCRIHADVYRPAANSAASPVVVFIHGGALVMGSREWANAAHLSALNEAGYAVAAVDYRLAPETKLP